MMSVGVINKNTDYRNNSTRGGGTGSRFGTIGGLQSGGGGGGRPPPRADDDGDDDDDDDPEMNLYTGGERR